MNQNQPLLLACWDTNSCCSCWDTNSWGIPLPRFWRNPFFCNRAVSSQLDCSYFTSSLPGCSSEWDWPPGSAVFVHRTSIQWNSWYGGQAGANRIPWCLDVWRMFESFSMKQSPKHHFWRLGLQYQNILKSLSKKDGYDYWISTHSLSLSISLSQSTVCVCFCACPMIYYLQLPSNT